MSAIHTQCPPESILSDFGLGKLDATSAETVSQHLETCGDCRQRVASLSGDSFVGRLRQVGSAAKPDAKRERTYVPGESLANAASSTDGSSVRESRRAGIPRPSRTADDQPRRDGLRSPSSPVSAPPELTNHPDYELVKELGQGGMGTVYLARNRMMDRHEVLKVISTALLSRPGALERFQQEIRSAAKLLHPNIVAAHSVLRPGDLLVFAMEYVKGQDLSQVVQQRGPLPVANAAFYIHQVALGLQHALEKGMVHRDIKPNNLILAIEGKKHTVKILDFGLAKATSEKGAEAGLTKSGQMLGTPDYVAPEQTLDAHKADIRADIYSLGCTLYFLLSGGPPFQETSLFEILKAHHEREPKSLNLVRPEVPVELATVVAKMMAKDPTKRYQTPVEVAKALVPFFKPGQTIVAPPTDTGQSQPAEATHRISAATPVSIITPPVASPVPLVAPPVALAPRVKPAPQFGVSVDTRRPAVKRRGWRLSLPPWQRWTVAGSAAALLLLGVVLLLRTSRGMVEIQLSDPNANVTVTVDGNAIDIAGLDKPLSLEVGTHDLNVKGAGYEAITKQFTVTRGKNATLTVRLLPDLDGALISQGDANALNDASWRIVVRRDAQANDYRRALRLAQAACKIEPETGYYLNTLGVAQYRVGQFGEALATLNRSTKLNVVDGAPEPADVAFLAMTHHALGNADSAKTLLAQMRELAKQPGWRDNAEAQSLLREAEEEVKMADYYAIATGKWLHVMPGETALQENWVAIPQQTPVDVIIRARVKKVSGQNLGLYLRSEEAPPPERKFGYAAWFSGGNSFGVFKWSEGSKGDLLTCRTANNFDDYFEFAFSAVGELLSIYVDGQRIAEVRDADYRPGSLGIATRGGQSLFQDVEIMILDKESAPRAEDDWAPLFNGNDLTGWKTHPSQPGKWRVENGVLIGSGPAPSHLYSQRGDFNDFHLRVEARVNKGGDSGVYARSKFGPAWGPPKKPRMWLDGYSAQIYGGGPFEFKTGSLLVPRNVALVRMDTSIAPPNEWLTLELIAEGNHLVVKVNGRTTADYIDPKRRFSKGHITLQQHDAKTVIGFRKIEIKELQ